MKLLIGLLFGVCALAAAQPPAEQAGNQPPSEASPANPEAAGADQERSDQERADQEHKEGAPTMPLDALRENFGTVVENFITARSRDGYWPLKQKTTGKILKLKLETVKESSVREVEPGHVSGRVILIQADKSRIEADFFVDFSASVWTVEKLRLLPAQAKAKKANEAPEESAQKQ